MIGSRRHALVVAAVLTSLLFGVLHTEQDVAGVTVVTLDALSYAVQRSARSTGLW